MAALITSASLRVYLSCQVFIRSVRRVQLLYVSVIVHMETDSQLLEARLTILQLYLVHLLIILHFLTFN